MRLCRKCRNLYIYKRPNLKYKSMYIAVYGCRNSHCVGSLNNK